MLVKPRSMGLGTGTKVRDTIGSTVYFAATLHAYDNVYPES